MHQSTRYLDQSWHQAAESRSQRDAAHHKEADLSQVNGTTSLVTKAERTGGDDNRSL